MGKFLAVLLFCSQACAQSNPGFEKDWNRQRRCNPVYTNDDLRGDRMRLPTPVCPPKSRPNSCAMPASEGWVREYKDLGTRFVPTGPSRPVYVMPIYVYPPYGR